MFSVLLPNFTYHQFMEVSQCLRQRSSSVEEKESKSHQATSPCPRERSSHLQLEKKRGKGENVKLFSVLAGVQI